MLNMAERVGFEPTCRLPDNTLSRRARYDHFGTSPQKAASKRTFYYSLHRRGRLDAEATMARVQIRYCKV